MNNIFSSIISRPILRNYVLVILFFSSLSWFFAFGIYNNSRGQQIILHYSVKIGADQIANAINIFTLPAAGLMLFIVNFIIAYRTSKTANIHTHLLLFSALVINQLLLATLYSIYLINLIDF